MLTAVHTTESNITVGKLTKVQLKRESKDLIPTGFITSHR